MTTFPHLLQVCGSMQKPCLNKKRHFNVIGENNRTAKTGDGTISLLLVCTIYCLVTIFLFQQVISDVSGECVQRVTIQIKHYLKRNVNKNVSNDMTVSCLKFNYLNLNVEQCI